MSQSSDKPAICYLICVYNDQQGLDVSLESIYADDLLADILIIDDGSKTPAQIHAPPPAPSSAKDLSIKADLISLEQNVGLPNALNAGVKIILERGYEYIARLDAGDTVNKGRLAAQLAYLQDNADIAILGTGVRAFDEESGETLFEFNNPCDPREVHKTLKIRNCLPHPTVMMRTEIFKNYGLYDPNSIYAEDYELWRRVNQHRKCANLPENFVNKEISPQQITSKSRKKGILSSLRTQLRYMNIFSIWCWTGIIRSCLALLLPRNLQLHLRYKTNTKNKAAAS